MNKLIIIVLFLFSSITIFAQKNYSGYYFFEKKINVSEEEKKEMRDDNPRGRNGEVRLLKADGKNLYRFWLNIDNGFPSYHVGEIDGFIEIKNDAALFRILQDKEYQPCKLSFRFYDNGVNITQSGTDIDCGFGASVSIDDKFPLKRKNAFTEKEFEKKFFYAKKYRINVAKSYLYSDNSRTKNKKQYFIQGDIVSVFENKDGSLYVEYVTPKGKFIYGWISSIEADLIEVIKN